LPRASGHHGLKHFRAPLPTLRPYSSRQHASISNLTSLRHRNTMITGERTMTYALIRRLVSTKTLLRIAFAALSLHATGAAFAQGLSAGATAPMYGTTWAATRSQSQNLNAQNMTSEASKTARAETHRTGG
jgi:hypothetical protein